MSLPVIVIGAGGHAKVLIEVLKIQSCEIIGIVDADTHKIGTAVSGVSVIGNDNAIRSYMPDAVLLVNGIGSIAQTTHRQHIFEMLKTYGYFFASVIHPSAIVAEDVVIGEGAQIMAGAIIQPGSRIGRNAIINTGARIDHDCKIGDHAHIAPGVTLSGGVSVGVSAHIGTGATVIQEVAIGARAIIGAGAVVIKRIPSGVTAVGVPAKVV